MVEPDQDKWEIVGAYTQFTDSIYRPDKGISVTGLIEEQVALYKSIFRAYERVNEDAVTQGFENLDKVRQAVVPTATCSHSQMAWVLKGIQSMMLPALAGAHVEEKEPNIEGLCAYLNSLDGTKPVCHPYPGQGHRFIAEIGHSEHGLFSGEARALRTMVNPAAIVSEGMYGLIADALHRHSPTLGESWAWDENGIEALRNLAMLINGSSEANEGVDDEVHLDDALTDHEMSSFWNISQEEFACFHPQLQKLLRGLASVGYNGIHVPERSTLNAEDSNLTGPIKVWVSDFLPVVNGEIVWQVFSPTVPQGTHCSFIRRFTELQVIGGRINGVCECAGPEDRTPILPVLGGIVFRGVVNPSGQYYDFINCKNVTNVNGQIHAIINDYPFINGRLERFVDGQRISSFDDLHIVNGLINGRVVTENHHWFMPVFDGKIVTELDGKRIKSCLCCFNVGGHMYGCVRVHTDDRPDSLYGEPFLIVDSALVGEIEGKEISDFHRPQEYSINTFSMREVEVSLAGEYPPRRIKLDRGLQA